MFTTFDPPPTFAGVQEVCTRTGPIERPLTEQPCSGYILKAQPEERYEGTQLEALGNGRLGLHTKNITG